MARTPPADVPTQCPNCGKPVYGMVRHCFACGHELNLAERVREQRQREDAEREARRQRSGWFRLRRLFERPPPPPPGLAAVREIPAANLRAFANSDHVAFAGDWAAPEEDDPAQIEARGFRVMYRDRHWTVAGKVYDALVKTPDARLYLACLVRRR
jgi:hypothetical protein